MAATTTTLAAAVGVNENTIKVTSATGFAVDSLIRVDNEIMRVMSITGTLIKVFRGWDGTLTAAHVNAANVTVELTTDYGERPAGVAGSTTYPAARARTMTSYSASGAIVLPSPGSDAVAVLNGTAALAMTLAVPTKDQDGDILYVVANGKVAHTVTATGGFGANTTASDVMTFHATQTTAFACMACNGVWVLIGYVAGVATVAGGGLG